MAESRVGRYLAQHEARKQKKRPWLDHYQRLAEMFLTWKADFTNAANVGAFLSDNVFSNVPQFAANLFASVCQSMLWPDAARSFAIVPKPQLKDLPGVQAYFRAVTNRMHAAMDNPEAGLSLALSEHFLEQGVFGTSGVATLEGPADDASLPVVYECWDVKSMFIDEDRHGNVNSVTIEEQSTVRKVYEEYKLNGKPGDKISSKVAEAYTEGRYEEKVTVLKVLEPNDKRDIKKKGIVAMEYRTCHIDATNRVIMRESGYEEMPVAVVRAIKRSGETQGRSFGMIVLPAAVNLNSLSQDIIVGSELQLFPPLMVLDDGRLGGAVIDTSAKGMTVVNTAGRPFGEKPIQALHTVGDMVSAKELKTQLTEEVMQGFMLDRLLDLNNKTMMTAYETSVRSRLRGESTGSLFARQIMELFVKMIRRTFNILMRRGDLGDFPGVNGVGADQRRKWVSLGGKDDVVVPESVLAAVKAGLDVYDIEFISPAQRFMQAEKLNGLLTSADSKLAVAALQPDIMDGTDWDEWGRLVDKYAGAPNAAQRTKDGLAEYRRAVAQRQQTADMLGAGKVASDIQAQSAKARVALGTMGDK